MRAEEFGIADEAAADDGVDHVLDAPAAHARVKREDQEDREDADAAEEAPAPAADLGERGHRALASGAAHGEFGHEQRDADGEGEEDVGQHEDGAAVRARHVRELPDGAEADGRACACKNEAEA